MSNRLIHESSPYLLQHAGNPVDWYPYGDEAFAEAQTSNRPLLISIGYSACHWCHVMEHESFSRPDIAEIMNTHFICIKVDREERPDVDQMYMGAVQLLNGNGGWPLNCFALPDGRPFWGGTYFRPEQWVELLSQLNDLYQKSFHELETQAERLSKGIAGIGIIKMPVNPRPLSLEMIGEAYDQLSVSFDAELGGLRGAPKFPMPVLWQFVLNYHYLTRLPDALAQVKTTLMRMAQGGIFDQIGGGFARYSTDSTWKVPHFEKMLYDNAQLISLYAGIFRLTGDRFYSGVFERTIGFVIRELTAPEGAFYAALDADSEGEEGLFYLWTRPQLQGILPEYADLLADYWGIDGDGVWEKGRSILLRPVNDALFASRRHLSEEELRQLLSMSAAVLLAARNKRPRPALDNKILTSWNALMIKGLVDAVKAAANKAWLDAALKAGEFIHAQLSDSGRKLYRSWNNGNPVTEGFLDDYAFTADAFIALYQVTFDEKWIFRADQLVQQVNQLFADTGGPFYWFTSGGDSNTKTTVVRMIETTDGVESSGNAVMAGVLLALGHYLDNPDYLGKATQMVVNMQQHFVTHPASHACWAIQAAAIANGITTIVVSGPDAFKNAGILNRKYLPDVIVAAAVEKSGLPIFKDRFRPGLNMIYKCTGNTCSSPVNSVLDLSLNPVTQP